MYKNIFIILLLVVSLSACGLKQTTSTDVVDNGITASPEPQEPELLDTSNFVSSIGNSTTQDQVEDVEITSIEDKLLRFSTQADTLELMVNVRNNNWFEEFPNIETYYSQSPFYEFYIYNAFKTWDITQCDTIVWVDKINLCKDLFWAIDDEEEYVNIYSNYGETFDFIDNSFAAVNGIRNGSCIGMSNILLYASCRKMLDENVDVRDLLVKFNILKSSILDAKLYYEEISDHWEMDESFKDLMKNYLALN